MPRTPTLEATIERIEAINKSIELHQEKLEQRKEELEKAQNTLQTLIPENKDALETWIQTRRAGLDAFESLLSKSK